MLNSRQASARPATLSVVGEFVERRPVLASATLVVLTLFSHAVILATPGFFSFDEWQKFDHVEAHGFWHFARAHGELRAGQEFGYPVRPIGFLQQGVAALWMRSAPWAAHLIGILNHALVALAFVWALRRAGLASATAAFAGVFFVLSPLTTMATGWVAASFDQLYILFLLLAAVVIVRLPVDGVSLLRAAGIMAATIAALLSKETAIVAPAGVMLLAWLAWAADPARFSWRPCGRTYAIALALVSAPIAAYLLYRAPAIVQSLAGNATKEYVPDFSKIPTNAFRYFAYPFRIRTVELSAGVFGSPWQPAGAALVHLLLVGAVYRCFGWAFALAYVGGYFLFLSPVLALPSSVAHYLYGAGLAMSLAVAALLVHLDAEGRPRTALLVIAGVVGLYAHSLAIQVRLYHDGACQTRFLDSVDALLAHDSSSIRRIHVSSEVGAATYVAIRAVHARERYEPDGIALFTFESPTSMAPTQATPGTTQVRLTAACTLRRM